MIVRFVGLGSIALCAIVIHFLYQSVHTAPPHAATGTELLLAAAAVLTGLGGVLMVSAGSALTGPANDRRS